MDSDFKNDGLKACPYCGTHVPEKAIYCGQCRMNLLAEFTDLDKGSALAPPLASTMLTGIALLLLIFLTGMAVLELNQWFAYAGYIYLGLVLVFLGILAARGRSGEPGVLQYLISLIIVFIPVVGFFYGIFFGARSIARVKGARIALYVLLLGMTALVFMYFGDLPVMQPVLAVAAQDTPLPTPTPRATATEMPTPTATQTAIPTATPVSTTEVPSPTLPVVADCTHWSDVTLEMIGQDACVYGDYVEIFQKEDKAYVMSFSGEQGAFQIWSGPRPMIDHIPDKDNHCVVARNRIMTSGIRPIIILHTSDLLENCGD